MPAYLLTWNPNFWNWDDIAKDIRRIETKGYTSRIWSTGHTKRVMPGDRVFLLRQGKNNPGVFGSGEVTSEVYEGKHWDKDRSGETCLYVDVSLDVLLDPATSPILAREDLRSGKLGKVNWNTQSSGITIPPDALQELEDRWAAHLLGLGMNPVSGPDEEVSPGRYPEGATKRVFVNRYERDPRARGKCIAHFGAICSVCGFDFESNYGKLGEGFIHVHHLVPLSSVGRNYQVDPIKDLRPVCPNCHAMLHRETEPMSIQALKNIIKRRRAK